MVNVDTIMQSSSYNIALPTTVKNRWAACYRMHCVLSKLRACKMATTHAGSGSSSAAAAPAAQPAETFQLSHETKVAIDGLAEVCFLMNKYILYGQGAQNLAESKSNSAGQSLISILSNCIIETTTNSRHHLATRWNNERQVHFVTYSMTCAFIPPNGWLTNAAHLITSTGRSIHTEPQLRQNEGC